MTLYNLETVKTPDDHTDYYALVAEGYTKNLSGHMGALGINFTMTVKQWRLSGSNYLEENLFNYSLHIESENVMLINCMDRLATEDVTNNVVAVHDEESSTIKIYVKTMITGAKMRITINDMTNRQILRVFKEPFLYPNIQPDFTCSKWKPHPIDYFSKYYNIQSNTTQRINTGIKPPKLYGNSYVETDVFIRNTNGKVYKEKQIIVMVNTGTPTIQSESYIYKDEINETNTSLIWSIENDNLLLTVNAHEGTVGCKILTQNKFYDL